MDSAYAGMTVIQRSPQGRRDKREKGLTFSLEG